ncbi:MAG: hypothetical protein JSR99_15550 [Proteobacteria bacterium]|nr:hypothetical protein [Pseudomonadota bacterium]
MKESRPDPIRRSPAFFNSSVFLAFILAAGPLAWSLDLLVKFVLASNACENPSRANEWIFDPSSFTIIDIVAIAVTALATWQAYQTWNATTTRQPGHFHTVTEVGEGRQHFLALWGMMIGAMFLSAIVFSFIVNLAIPPCTS